MLHACGTHKIICIAILFLQTILWNCFFSADPVQDHNPNGLDLEGLAQTESRFQRAGLQAVISPRFSLCLQPTVIPHTIHKGPLTFRISFWGMSGAALMGAFSGEHRMAFFLCVSAHSRV